eukprot:4798379-Amphidinium_carterae.1
MVPRESQVLMKAPWLTNTDRDVFVPHPQHLYLKLHKPPEVVCTQRAERTSSRCLMQELAPVCAWGSSEATTFQRTDDENRRISVSDLHGRNSIDNYGVLLSL